MSSSGNIDLKKQVETINNERVDLANQITTLNNTTLKNTRGAQIINANGNNVAYFEFKNDNTRIGMIGKCSSNNNNYTVQALTGDLYLAPGNTGSSINCDNYAVLNNRQPTANNHLTNKQYVDSKFNIRTINQSVNNGATYTIPQNTGYTMVAITPLRKNTTNNYYYTRKDEVNLQMQLWNESGNVWKFYNNGSSTGFGNDFRFIIMEIKS